MALNELRRVQKVVDVLEIVRVLLLRPALVVDVRDEPLPQLFYVVYRDVDVHLLMRLLHEIVLRQSAVYDLLGNWRLASLRLRHTVNCVEVLLKRAVRPAVVDLLRLIVHLHHGLCLLGFVFLMHVRVVFCSVACQDRV